MGTVEDWGTGFYRHAPDRPPQPGESWWPAGANVVQHNRLRQLLALGARHHARRAVIGSASSSFEDLLDAAVSCGSAVELIAKTLIASTSHALLADRGDRDSVLLLDGHGVHATQAATGLRSVAAVEALKIVKQLHKDVPVGFPELLPFRVRNAATHMALVDHAELRRAIVHMGKMVTAALTVLDLDEDSFWGEHAAPAVTDLLNEARSELARTVAAKNSAARHHYAQLIAAIPAQLAQSVVAAIAAQRRSWSDHEEPFTCPVCGSQGWLICGVDVGEPETMYDEKMEPIGLERPRTGYVIGFDCTVCNLEVEAEELSEYDFPDELELQPEEMVDNPWDEHGY